MIVLENLVKTKKIPKIPVYLDGMIWEATAIHTAYPEYLNNRLRAQIFQQGENPLISDIFKRVDSAAMVYVRLLSWGRHSGVLKRPNETPGEYGGRLMDHFPGLNQEIRQIVDAFNREIYGLIQTGPDMLADIRKAQRRMQSIRHWPVRVKVWLLN